MNREREICIYLCINVCVYIYIYNMYRERCCMCIYIYIYMCVYIYIYVYCILSGGVWLLFTDASIIPYHVMSCHSLVSCHVKKKHKPKHA